MKSKSWTKDLLALIVMCIVIVSAILMSTKYNEYVKTSYDFNLWIYTLLSIFSYGIVGAILGFNSLGVYRGRKGKWKVNFSKLIVLGIPSAICALSYLWMYFGLQLTNEVGGYIIPISNVVLGHTIVSSFYK